jgi:PAS domain S-box-containing protein
MRWSSKTKQQLTAEIRQLSKELDVLNSLDGFPRTQNVPVFDIRQTVDQLNMIGLTIERDGTMSYANPYTYRVTAWQPNDIIGKNFFDLLMLPAARDRARQDFEEALHRGTLSERREIDFVARSGAVRNVILNSAIASYLPGRATVSALTIIGEDTTNRRRVASALSNSNAQLQDLVDNTSDLIQMLSLDGKFTFVNRAWREVLGYTDTEITRLTLNDVLHPDYANTTRQRLQRIQEGEQSATFETVFRNKAGQTIFLSGSVNCRYDNGKPTAFRCILHNTTGRVRAERSQKLYYSIANWTLNSDSLDDLYEKIHQELGQIIDTRNFFIALYDQRKNYINFPYYVDEYFRDSMRFTKRKLGNDRTRPGLTEYTIRANKPLFLYGSDIRQLADDHQIDLYGQLQPQVMLTAPLRIGDEITGIIGVKSYNDPKTYGPRDLELLEFISGQIAQAIARKQSEAVLDKQNARLNAIFDSSTYLIWSVNRALQLTSFNNKYTALIEQQVGQTPTLNSIAPNIGWRMLNAENRKVLENKYKAAFKGQPQTFEMRVGLAQQEIWLDFQLNPILLAGGAIEEVSGIARDITNRKRAEISTRQSEEKFRGIFENLQDIYVRVDRKGHITMISPSVFKRMGYTPDEVLGQNAVPFFVDKSVIHRAMIRLVRNRSLRNFEATLRRKDGTERQFMFNMLLLQDDQTGEFSVVAALARDITELKKQSTELVKAKDEAERSLKVKERFLANMSHEIRTPMNGVIGMVDLLNDTVLNDEQRDYVRTIKRSSETLLNILNDILDLSKIEAGKMMLHESPVVLREIFEKLIALFGQQARTKNNRLTYALAPELPPFVIADQTRLLQILSNLTSNALKFTEHGEVSVKATLVSKRGKFNRIRVAVRDTGIGISPENIRLLFNSFSQVDNSSRKSFGGTGLGLAISKELAALMKGEIGVESTVGEGSTFWFEVEIKATDIAPTQQATDAAELPLENFFSTHQPVILLVDDNATNRKVASEILRKAGCVVTTADSGKAAIEEVRRKGRKEERKERDASVPSSLSSSSSLFSSFDLIFMDIQMPDMDGIETTRHLREEFGTTLPPIIAMTAYSMREDRERFLSQGLDDYVAKPIRAQTLITKVKETIEARAKTQASKAQDLRQQEIARQQAAPVIDPEIVGQLRDIGGQDLIDSIFEEFVTEATELVGESLTAFETADYVTIKSHLHTLKGSAGTIGVSRVAEIAREAEARLKVQDTSQLGHELKALEQAFGEFLAAFRAGITARG